MPMPVAFGKKLDVHFLNIMEIIDMILMNTGIGEC